MHADPGLQELRTARNDHLLLWLPRGPPRAVNALSTGSAGSLLLSGIETRSLDSLNNQNTTPVCFNLPAAHTAFKSLAAPGIWWQWLSQACPKLAVVTDTEELIKPQQWEKLSGPAMHLHFWQWQHKAASACVSLKAQPRARMPVEITECRLWCYLTSTEGGKKHGKIEVLQDSFQQDYSRLHAGETRGKVCIREVYSP